MSDKTQTPAQDRYSYRRDTILLEGATGGDCYVELHGYFIHEVGRSHEYPLAFAYDVTDAEKIVAALNRAAS